MRISFEIGFVDMVKREASFAALHGVEIARALNLAIHMPSFWRKIPPTAAARSKPSVPRGPVASRFAARFPIPPEGALASWPAFRPAPRSHSALQLAERRAAMPVFRPAADLPAKEGEAFMSLRSLGGLLSASAF
jgi:hypothetical protein